MSLTLTQENLRVGRTCGCTQQTGGATALFKLTLGSPVNIVRGLQASPQVIYFQTSPGSGSTGQKRASFIFTSVEDCGSYIKEIAVFTNSVFKKKCCLLQKGNLFSPHLHYILAKWEEGECHELSTQRITRTNYPTESESINFSLSYPLEFPNETMVRSPGNLQQ